MFKGYNLDLSKNEKQAFLNITDSEIAVYEQEIEKLREGLQENLDETIYLPRTSENKVDGSKLINDWFPNYKADVFISHSHNDVRTAKRLACWLKKSFNLNVFIDSTVWGNANDMLNKIDKKHSVLRRDKDGSLTYNYHTRNYTTSHVHMMLSTALNDMIHSTECIIFLNTPNSLKVNEAEKQKTNSPWIYSELKTASIVEKIRPRTKMLLEYIEKRDGSINHSIQNKLDIAYDVDKELSIFDSLDTEKLKSWQEVFSKSNKDLHPLDILYYII